MATKCITSPARGMPKPPLRSGFGTPAGGVRVNKGNKMEILENLFWSVLSGLVASGVFIFVLSTFRPSIKISPHIARETDDQGKFYAFKIINTSTRPCINVKVDATLAKLTHVEGGHTLWTTHLPLKQSEVFEMAQHQENDVNADYAWRFVTDVDLDDLWVSDSDLVRFRVLATDSFTGFSRSFFQEFRLARNSIKDGSHHFGLDLRVS